MRARVSETMAGMTGRPQPRAGRSAWCAVGVLSLVYAVAIVDRLIMPISIQDVRRSLGISDLQVSLMFGLAFAIFYSACGLPIGALVDRHSRRWIIIAGMLVWSLAATASGLARTPKELFAARMLVGAGEAALSPASYALLGDLFPKERLAAPISLFVIGGTLGAAAALGIGGPLLQYFHLHGGLVLPWVGKLEPWQSLYVCAGLPGLACIPLVAALPEPGRRRDRDPRGPSAGASPAENTFVAFIWEHRRLYGLLFLGFGTAAMLPYAYQAWIPALMMRSYRADPAVAGRTFGLILALCGIIAHGCNGFIVDRLFARGVRDAHLRYFIWTAAIGAPIAVFGFLSGEWAWLLVGVAAAHLLLTPFVGYAGAALQIITPPAMRGRISAAYLFVVSAIGLGLGPSAVALLAAILSKSHVQLGPVLALFTTLCVGAAIACLNRARPALITAMDEGSRRITRSSTG